MKSPLAESQREALIEAMLPDVPFDGWSRAALRAAARRIGVPAAEALALFPDGAADFAACFSRWADRRMLDRLESLPLDQLRVPERVALAVNIRLEIVEPWREAVRRAQRDRFQLLHKARHAGGNLRRNIALLAGGPIAGICRHPCFS
jgi:rpsU-divergently transcribed protein